MIVTHQKPVGWVDTDEAGVIQPSEVAGLVHVIELEAGDLLQGPQGEAGPMGPQGPQGLPGADGAQGAQGPQGLKGDTGAQGAQGPQGLKGDAGAQGAQGPQGLKGDAGAQGAQGPQGLKGDTGAQGAQGPQGLKGDTGAQGAQGPQGLKGDTGAQGAQGPQGLKGDTGAQGAQGPQGLKGDTGAQGAQGPQGPQGVQGASYEKGQPIVLGSCRHIGILEINGDDGLLASPGIKIKTKIGWQSGAFVKIDVKGFAYGAVKAVDLSVCFYAYAGQGPISVCSSRAVDSFKPAVSLINDGGYVSLWLGFVGSQGYFFWGSVDAVIRAGAVGAEVGWSFVSSADSAGSIPVAWVS